jgi:hypothetical protein
MLVKKPKKPPLKMQKTQQPIYKVGHCTPRRPGCATRSLQQTNHKYNLFSAPRARGNFKPYFLQLSFQGKFQQFADENLDYVVKDCLWDKNCVVSLSYGCSI